jgi:hypothetical protein
MTITTITTSIANNVTLGNGTYDTGITITNTGAVKPSSGTAIYAKNQSTYFKITNNGAISGDIGIATYGKLKLTNASTIDANGTGVYLASGAIFNSGTVLAHNYDAIDVGMSAYVQNTGLIAGYNYGIGFQAGSLANLAGGTVSGLNAVEARSGALTAANSGVILGRQDGVYTVEGGSIFNNGTINGGSNAVYNGHGAFTLAVGAGAVFAGNVSDLAGTGVLNLAGTTAGTLNMGTSFSGFSQINFGNAGWTLEGIGAELAGGETIAGFAGGNTIIITDFAATSDNFIAGTGLILNNGTTTEVLRLSAGINPNQPITLTSDGTSTTLAIATISTISNSVVTEVTLGAGGYTTNLTITRSGTINSTKNDAIFAQNASTHFTVANQGLISGLFDGIDLSGTLSATNTGSIRGLNDGILLASGSVINSGTINGTVFGIYALSGGSILNSGTINGGSRAVNNKSGAFTLSVNAGAVFNGAVFDNEGGGVLNLAGNTAGTLNMGSSFSGFAHINFGTASWTLKGNSAELTSGETITGLAIGDVISISDFAASADSFVAGQGLVLSNGTTTETLALSAAPTQRIALTSDGTGTTLAALPFITTIGTPVSSNVTLGNGTYATGLTVTSTGTVKPAAGYGIVDVGYLGSSTITNAGTIIGSDAIKVLGTLSAANTGTIDGSTTGIFLGLGSVTNSGTITGQAKYGVQLAKSGYIANSGLISGHVDGIDAAAGVSIRNSGSISGLTNAIYNKAGAFTLSVEAGAVFSGAVVDHAGNGTLNLTGSTDGHLNMGASFSGFSQINLGNAHWTLSGNKAELANGETIAGFTNGDTIDLADALASSASFGNNALTLLNASGTSIASLHITDPNTTTFTLAPDGGGGTDIIIPCFAAGTRLLASTGEVLVETIKVGDILVTVREGGPVSRKVVWTGKRTIDIRRHAAPDQVRPVRIIAGAIAPGVPERDLRLSPEHAVYIDGVLIPAISLVNGTTIYQEQTTRHVTYHHIELDSHDVLLAEGLAVESYLDTGNRTMFESASGLIALHPDFAPSDISGFCAPLISIGPRLDAIHAVIAARSRRPLKDAA